MILQLVASALKFALLHVVASDLSVAGAFGVLCLRLLVV